MSSGSQSPRSEDDFVPPPPLSTEQEDSDSEDEVPEVCNECELNPVGFFCVECDEWLCSSCAQSQHKTEARKAHQISDISTRKKLKTPHHDNTVRLVKAEGKGAVEDEKDYREDSLKRSNSKSTNSVSSASSSSPNDRIDSKTSGSTRSKCASKNCMSFAVKGTMCARHAWKENFQDVVHSNPKQFKVAEEIVTTEKTYQEGLYKAVNGFYNRLVVMNQLGRALIEKDELSKIFQNIEDIYKLSVKMYSDLNEILYERVLTSQIGTTLLHYAPQFRIYQGYMEAYEDSIGMLGEIRKRNPEFDHFCKWNEKAEGYSMESLLIMPVQRLPRYLLLLDELQKRTPEDDPALPDMKAAAERIKRVTESINKSLHTKDNTGEIRELMEKFEKDDRFVDLVAPERRLIMDGPLKKHFSKLSRHITKTKQYRFFLFSDILVYAAESRTFGGVTYQLKHVLPLADMEIKQLGQEKDLLIRCGKKKSISVSCSSLEERLYWYNKIQSAIEAYQSERREGIKVTTYDGANSVGVVKGSKAAALIGV